MRVLEVVSRGGFGRVERVQLVAGDIVARKVFDPQPHIQQVADLQKLRKRFDREVRVQETLSHDYFVPILESDLSADEPWFTMPLADKNLRQEIDVCRANGTVPDSALADILNSLERLHELGFVHRDLKPENVLHYEERWKLSDFGLVLPTSNLTTQLSSVNSAWGTAAYCAPEQASAFRDATPKVDIYAFGCVLHDVFVGQARVPYSRQTGDGAIGRIIEKCTEDDPRRRFKDIASLRGALLTILSTQPIHRPSAGAEEWASKLHSADGWNSEQLEDLARYVRAGLNYSDRWTIFTSFSEEMIDLLYSIDGELCKIIALEYCEWVREREFNFQYCDVVIVKLERLVELGDLDVKVSALVAAAKLGKSHNRWFVMGHLMKLCGPSMDDYVAERLAIEIVVEGTDARRNFVACAKQLTLAIANYHPKIAACLESTRPEP